MTAIVSSLVNFGVSPILAAEKPSVSMKLSSPAFTQGQPIPVEYTCKGADKSPPLVWTNAPPDTKSFALIMDDPDAPGGTWIHWVYYNLPPSATRLPIGIPPVRTPPEGGQQGMNSFNRIGYGGPCPPAGRPHRYFFRLFALDTELRLKSGANRAELDRALQGHVIAQGELMGTFQRK